jgi:hypothetical protein
MAAGKLVKRIFITIGIIIGLLLVTAIIIPVFFKDKIMAVVKQQLNEQLLATTDFKDVDISIFRNFPRLSVGIQDLSVVGRDDFKGDTLIAAKSIDIAVDLMKAALTILRILRSLAHVSMPSCTGMVRPTGTSPSLLRHQPLLKASHSACSSVSIL